MVTHNIRPRANRKPMALLAEPKSVFTVVKLTTTKPEGGDEVGAEAPVVSVRGIHPTEEQAYAAAMLDLMYSLEESEGNTLPKVRAIAKTKTLPAKDRLKSIQSCQDPEAAERVEFLVRRSNIFPESEKDGVDMEALLEGPLLPCTLWDSDDDEEDYAPSSSSDSEDEEVDEDEDMELVDERDVFEGVEGSGTKEKEEEEAVQA